MKKIPVVVKLGEPATLDDVLQLRPLGRRRPPPGHPLRGVLSAITFGLADRNG